MDSAAQPRYPCVLAAERKVLRLLQIKLTILYLQCKTKPSLSSLVAHKLAHIRCAFTQASCLSAKLRSGACQTRTAQEVRLFSLGLVSHGGSHA